MPVALSATCKPSFDRLHHGGLRRLRRHNPRLLLVHAVFPCELIGPPLLVAALLTRRRADTFANPRLGDNRVPGRLRKPRASAFATLSAAQRRLPFQRPPPRGRAPPSPALYRCAR